MRAGWRVIRTSNAYVFRDPKAAVPGGFSSKSENPPGTLNQDILDLVIGPPGDPDSPLKRALARLSAAIGAKNGIEQGSGQAGTT
jgi:hypothetical protein